MFEKVYQIYDVLIASTFLFNNGVDGLKSNLSRNWNDYILFSDDSITIEDVKYEP